MNNIRYILLALAALLATGCGKVSVPEPGGGEAGVYALTLQCEDPTTRGMADGARENVNWNNWDMRYILEIWREGVRDIRLVGRTDTFTGGITFDDIYLLRNKRYSIYCWADVVPQGTLADYHYSTDEGAYGLQYVIRTDNWATHGKIWSGNDDTVDAYAFSYNNVTPVDIFYAGQFGFVKLKRPLSKVITRVTGLAAPVTDVYVGYDEAGTYYAYNVATDTAFGGGTAPYYEARAAGDFSNGTQTLAWDYHFVGVNNTATKISYDLMAPDNAHPTLRQRYTDVPIATNTRTNVSGGIKKLYYAGDYYRNGAIEGIVYKAVTAADNLTQTIAIVSLDCAVNTPATPAVWPYAAQGTATWDQAAAFASGHAGGGWKLPSRADLQALNQAAVDFTYGAFNAAISAKGGTTLDFFATDATGTDFRFVSYWTSDVSGTNAYIGWLAPTAVSTVSVAVAKTENHFGRAVRTGLSN